MPVFCNQLFLTLIYVNLWKDIKSENIGMSSQNTRNMV